ncbi:MAG: DUF58 domain-containing protein [Clostridiales bacterium]|nr:DUF58 domain-containing protein [Clostridiales bacterium]
MIRLYRIIYYTLMVLTLLGGLINGISAYYIVFFFQLFLVLFSLALNIWTIASFSYTQKVENRRTVKGDELILKLGIFNDKPFPFNMMKVHVKSVSEKQQIDLSFNLMPNDKIEFDLPIDVSYRGVHFIGMTMLEFTDIFGLCPMKMDMRRLPYYKQIELMVYPRLNLLPNIKSNSGDTKEFDGFNLDAAPSGDSFADLKEYQKGDAAKRIHWKQSFAKQKLFVKQFDLPRETRSLFFIDDKKTFEGEDQHLYADVVCECTAALLYHASAQHHPCDIYDSSRDEHMTIYGRSGFNPVYDYLALLPFDAQRDIAQTLSAATQSNKDGIYAIYVLTSRITDALVDVLNEAAGLDVRSTVIVCQGDASLDSENEKKLYNANVIRVNYGDDIEKLLGEGLA